MARRMITNNRCPICGDAVEMVKDALLKNNPHYSNAEFVVTKRGLKQYIHSSCWYNMIEQKLPYEGKMYV